MKYTVEYEHICTRCGKRFTNKHETDALCRTCKLQLGQKPRGAAKSRPLTRDTPFLVQKWLAEGMRPSEAAEILERPITDIYAAMKIPLTAGQREAIKQHFSPKASGAADDAEMIRGAWDAFRQTPQAKRLQAAVLRNAAANQDGES